MAIKSIDGASLRKMILNGAKILDSNKQHVDSLNVFPVPDGDTGTNMSLTLVSAAKELANCPNNNMDQLSECISRGALRGARGNSGVITSQILKGMCLEFAKCEGNINLNAFAKSLKSGSDYAYKAVTKPQEGTILTVIRTMSEQGLKFAKHSTDYIEFFKTVLRVGEETLKKTPDMLPVLKKAGVVDAGGRGLLIVFQGFYNSLMGKDEVNLEFDDSIRSASEGKGNNYEQFHVNLKTLDDIEFAYCTEFFVINLKKTTDEKQTDEFRNKLMNIGDCVLVIGDSDFIKVHVHTNNPGQALEYATELGELDSVKIENMLLQYRELTKIEEENLKPQGMVSICSGNGMASIFKDLTVDEIVEGGQTMNPSAEDIAKACDRVFAETVFVMPNNKNIIMAANQAKDISKRKVMVIPTVNVPQGFSAVLAFDPQQSPEDNFKSISANYSSVISGSVTFAVRSTELDGFKLKKDDIIGLSDKSILTAGHNVSDVTADLIDKLYNEDVCTITLYYGYGTSEDDANALAERIQEKYPDCDVAVYEGGQALYYYIISLE